MQVVQELQQIVMGPFFFFEEWVFASLDLVQRKTKKEKKF